MTFLFRIFIWLSVLCSLSGFYQRAEAQPQERAPHLMTGRLGMPAVMVGTKIYVIGGAGPGGYRSDIECIDTQAPTPAVTVQETTLRPRVFHTAEAQGPFIYVMGGLVFEKDNEIHYASQVERLDTRDGSIELMAPLPFGLRNAASVLIGDKIYLVGGSTEDGMSVDSLLIYDIAANTWKTGAPLPEKKECDVLAWHGGLLALGGFNGKDQLAGVESYDIATDTWTALPSLPTPTSAHHGAVVTDATGTEHVVLFGDYNELTRVLSGNPLTGQWQNIDTSGFTSRRHTAVVAVGEKIFVIGGSVYSLGSFIDDIQQFEAQNLITAP